MQTHGPKRIYTPQSLEFWFGRMEVDWEGQFDATHVDRGHDMYRDGEIREVELGAKDAIIHRKVEKKEEYAVIEWDNDRIKVRSSSTDVLLANAIAVAGLHEIEELLVDEMAALLPGALPKASPAAHGHHASANGNGNGANDAPKPDAPARDLLLSFTTNADGLVFLAYWKSGRSRIPALGNTANPPTAAERAKLIALATYARKAHFRYNQSTHAYALDALADIPGFLRDLLPHWKKQFAIELDVKVDNIKQGARAIEIEAVADRRGDGGLNLRWIFRAGEKLLTDEQAAALLKHGRTPMLLPDLGIVTLTPEKLEGYNQWRRNLEDTAAAGEIPPYLIFSLFNDHRLKVTLGPEIEAWRQKVLTPPATPPELPEYLRNYQRRGVEWMHHLCETECHGLLADEMGLGKTAQVIALLRTRPMAKFRHVVVCPASVVPVWREEIARFYPEAKVDILKSGNDFKTNKAPCIWLASYTQLRKHRALLDTTEFGYAILDEGQFIKNPDAKVTQACFAIKTRHRLVMTGTPLENRQLDLWSIFRYLLPGLLGSRAGFESALVLDRERTMNRLRQQVAPFILRRTKNEVATELPPKVEMDLLCPLTEVQRAEYARICTEGLARLGEDISLALREKSFGFLALLTRLRQVCCDPDLLPWMNSPLTDSGKLQLLVEKLSEVVASGHKVVIFSQFVTLLDRVRTALDQHYPDLPRYEITGMTVDRQKPVKDFQSAAGAAAMLVSLKAAGTGITLHAADYVFLLDPWWNPAVEDQAIDRVHRIGQTNTVFVYRMVTAGTIEERIQSLKGEKKQLFNQVVGHHSGDFEWTKHFSSLNSLIQLSAVEAGETELLNAAVATGPLGPALPAEPVPVITPPVAS
ncbi:DEAD/DEAH box helicase [Opitutus sp. GAS368]|uniref:DEAD/DEAH box helicase n=1 Tax=Opitutus sp. GAS368 TaxID=1882749 RepID=UPI00087D00B0|nr:DEAD/DEAH box helicase [Opitutus sp. GAS368]SDR67599.1 Helicase conserved C-terminal domain-containing protein [Opitutus sp. GAS368]